MPVRCASTDPLGTKCRPISRLGGDSSTEDARDEQDRRITHRPHKAHWPTRLSMDWAYFRLLHRSSAAAQKAIPVRAQYMAAHVADCALQIGGDNYSLEYGKPLTHMHVDRALKSVRVPLVLWGASVGPFTADPEFEREMCTHLGLFDLILARETGSVSYLASIGVEKNVKRVADPAFTMKPKQPACSDELMAFLDRGPIGLNLSPLIGRYTNDGGSTWPHRAAACLKELVGADLGPVLLVPHGTLPGNDDHAFLQGLADEIGAGQDRVMVAPRSLVTREAKWMISQTTVFIGARTHATIAALSSSVPTISIGYSLKARGINKDIFGHTDWVLPVDRFAPEVLVERCRTLLDQRDAVHTHLVNTMPAIRELSYSAGRYLADVMKDAS